INMSEPPPPPYTASAGDSEKQGPPGQAMPYPPQGGSYPPQGGSYPPQGGSYPPQGQQYPVSSGYQAQPGYPPTSYAPGGGYAPVVTAQPTTVVVMTNQNFRDVPVNTVCQFCNQQIITCIRFQDGLLTYLACVGICLIGCDLGCCLIPFCLDSCKDVVHTCPNCNHKLGKFSRV
ncbi:hypothetical protein BOX15_Mlig024054g1, partial [Macrostomum lignano]